MQKKIVPRSCTFMPLSFIQSIDFEINFGISQKPSKLKNCKLISYAAAAASMRMYSRVSKLLMKRFNCVCILSLAWSWFLMQTVWISRLNFAALSFVSNVFFFSRFSLDLRYTLNFLVAEDFSLKIVSKMLLESFSI